MGFLRLLAVLVGVGLLGGQSVAEGYKEVVVRGVFVRAVDDKERRYRIESFSKSMRRHGVEDEIESCGDILRVPVGVVDGNDSYGAVCNFFRNGNAYKAFICNDVMVGHFYIGTEYLDDPQWIANSVFDHCYGG
ncbi:hypothetical protein [Pseudomonas citronellolis]|uniref:hypothetical protein n=1 Tax=Pseudomonas citronellolis TaxID=53408 RepID=UPI0011C15345|nr:hypothetical protein [Pseudomonas citronellolis]